MNLFYTGTALVLVFGTLGVVKCQFPANMAQMAQMFGNMQGGMGGAGPTAGLGGLTSGLGATSGLGGLTGGLGAVAPAPTNPLSGIQELLGGRQKLSDACTYLKTRTSIWGKNNAPFKLETDGFHADVRRGYPIEVAIKPWSQYHADNFTDFMIYASTGGVSNFEAQIMQSVAPTFLGVFKIVKEYSAGARGFMCDPRAKGPDAFGSAEERRILINRALKPNNQFWKSRQPALRQYAAALWYPTEAAMAATSIQFVAKVKSDGHWYELRSKTLTPYNPPDPWQSLASSLAQYQSMQQNMRQLEMQAKTAVV